MVYFKIHPYTAHRQCHYQEWPVPAQSVRTASIFHKAGACVYRRHISYVTPSEFLVPCVHYKGAVVIVFCGTLFGEHWSEVRKLKWMLRVGNNLTVNVGGGREKYGRGNQTTSSRGNL